jgi:hypothetical protein
MWPRREKAKSARLAQLRIFWPPAGQQCDIPSAELTDIFLLVKGALAPSLCE